MPRQVRTLFTALLLLCSLNTLCYGYASHDHPVVTKAQHRLIDLFYHNIISYPRFQAFNNSVRNHDIPIKIKVLIGDVLIGLSDITASSAKSSHKNAKALLAIYEKILSDDKKNYPRFIKNSAYFSESIGNVGFLVRNTNLSPKLQTLLLEALINHPNNQNFAFGLQGLGLAAREYAYLKATPLLIAFLAKHPKHLSIAQGLWGAGQLVHSGLLTRMNTQKLLSLLDKQKTDRDFTEKMVKLGEAIHTTKNKQWVIDQALTLMAKPA
jgi:hypothetical protein